MSRWLLWRFYTPAILPMKTLTCQKIIDLRKAIPSNKQCKIDFDAANNLYALVYDEDKTNNEQDYELYHWLLDQASIKPVVWQFRGKNLEQKYFNVLPNHQMLFVYPRAQKLVNGEGQKNAKIINADGQIVKTWCIGDGIAHIQVTPSGKIWAAYYDEGIFGNLGWEMDDAIGKSGLVCWNPEGVIEFDFSELIGEGINGIDDCYAMNVVNEDEVWICYYMDFPLVKIKNRQFAGQWQSPVSGTHIFAVTENRIVMGPGYGQDFFTGFKLLSNGQIENLFQFKLIGQAGNILDSIHGIARGSKMYFLQDKQVYLMDLEELN